MLTPPARPCIDPRTTQVQPGQDAARTYKIEHSGWDKYKMAVSQDRQVNSNYSIISKEYIIRGPWPIGGRTLARMATKRGYRSKSKMKSQMLNDSVSQRQSLPQTTLFVRIS